MLDEILKRNIRESLVFALHTSQPDLLKKRLIVSEFFHSLNRKGLILNNEVDNLIHEAYQQIYALEEEQPSERRCRFCGNMQGYGTEGSMRCIKELSKSDEDAKTCKEFWFFLEPEGKKQ